MVVQQDFEKGRSYRLWFRRCSGNTIVKKTSPFAIFFQGLMLGAGGGGLYAVLYGICKSYFDLLNCSGLVPFWGYDSTVQTKWCRY